MIKNIFIMLSIFFPLTSFALTCPSVDELNQALKTIPDQTFKAGYQFPHHPGFATPWTYTGMPSGGQVKAFISATIRATLQNEHQYSGENTCMYYAEWVGENRNLPIYFVNHDKGPFVPVNGSWGWSGEYQNHKSCIVRGFDPGVDQNSCQFQSMIVDADRR